MRFFPVATVLLAGSLALGCSGKRIPGLEFELADTPDHRALVSIVEKFRTAFEAKDVPGIKALASKRFYEDSGNPETDDDYAYGGLEEHFDKHFDRVKKVQLTITLKDVRVDKDKAEVDYRYVTRYLMDLPAGEKWQVTDEINQIELIKEGENWKVISGF